MEDSVNKNESENEGENENENENESASADRTEGAKRSVVISRKAKVVFGRKSRLGEGEDKAKDNGSTDQVECDRDVFSVMDVIGGRLESLGGREEMNDIVVSVHSTEDPDSSDPLPEGGSRWEGPYAVGGVEVENLSIPDALSALSKAVIPADTAMKGVERLAEQYFLRSRLDGFVFVCTFDGQPAVVPLISSFKAPSSSCFSELYRQLHSQAENLKTWVSRKFPEIAAVTDWSVGDRTSPSSKSEKSANGGTPPGILGPDGSPVGAACTARTAQGRKGGASGR